MQSDLIQYTVLNISMQCDNQIKHVSYWHKFIKCIYNIYPIYKLYAVVQILFKKGHFTFIRF